MPCKNNYEPFDVECGPGWKCLIWPLIRRCNLEGATIVQIKEKFGGLRFYSDRASNELLDAINDAEDLSYKICENCGNPGKVHPGGWIKTLCDQCAVA